MLNQLKKKGVLKATIFEIIVAFICSSLIIGLFFFIFYSPIKETFQIIDIVSEKSNKKVLKDVKLNLETKNLESYPEYGTKYATLSIPSVNIEQPVYYGDDNETLKYGVGQYIASYFPGEGGSILYMGHNTSNMLRNLPNVSLGDEIIVTTNYGTYHYTIEDTKIIKDTELDKVPIKREGEVLMIYTCYPTTTVVYTPYRFVVYASLKK
ncbi:MAG: class D sortase [Bacilli bacterium]|nr:class D sortase [Bacilli bacterium]